MMCLALAGDSLTEFANILTKTEMWIVELYYMVKTDSNCELKHPEHEFKNQSPEEQNIIKELLRKAHNG